MKRPSRTNKIFESLRQPKFHTVEASELERMHGGALVAMTTLTTLTITPSGAYDDPGDPGDPEE